MTYRGYTLFDRTPLAEAKNNISNPYIYVGSDFKKQEKAAFAATNSAFEWTYLARGKADANMLRSFFETNKGRYGAFWLPSYKNDYTLTVAAASGSNQLVVKNAKRNFGLYGLKRHLHIPSLGFAAKIISVTLSDGTLNSDEVITLDTALPSTISTLSQPNIQSLFLVRLKSDEFTLTKRDKVYFQTTLGFVELQGETP